MLFHGAVHLVERERLDYFGILIEPGDIVTAMNRSQKRSGHAIRRGEADFETADEIIFPIIEFGGRDTLVGQTWR